MTYITMNAEDVRAVMSGLQTSVLTLVKPSVTGASPGLVGATVPVKEPWRILYVSRSEKTSVIEFRAGGTKEISSVYSPSSNKQWLSPVSMPQQAVRLYLTVISSKLRKLQDMSVPDVVAWGIWDDCRGCLKCYGDSGTPCCVGDESECHLVNSVFAEAKKAWNRRFRCREDCVQYGWEANPWVYDIRFALKEQP